jgi:short-subunit dehydrogenase
MTCDVTDEAAVQVMLDRSVQQLGGLDILINNAGVGVYGETVRSTMKDFREVMEVNYFGAVNCLLQALPLIRETGGLVVNIVSVAAIRGVPFLGAYGASKAALVSLSQSLRSELAGSGVRIMLVYPGYTQTGFFASEKLVGGARRPDGPYTSAEKVAGAVVRAMEKGKRDLVLAMEGRALRWLQALFPGMLERMMERYAARHRVSSE